MSAYSMIVFDKDGTLLDYATTWDGVYATVLSWAVGGDIDPLRWEQAAAAIGFDPATNTTMPGSPLIAETNAVVGEILMPWCMPERVPDLGSLVDKVAAAGRDSATEMAGATDMLDGLLHRDVQAVIATNDTERGAKGAVHVLGWDRYFAAVYGADSGFGPKPGSGMVVAALAQFDVEPERALMVGDSSHDIAAGIGAAVTTVLLDPTGSAPDDSWGADITISRLDELLDLVDMGRPG